MVGSGMWRRSVRPCRIDSGTSSPKASASATASGVCGSPMRSSTRILAASTDSVPGRPSTDSMRPSGFSSRDSGQRVIATTTASPSLPLFPPEPSASIARGSTMGPRTRVSSGSSQALLPFRCSVPATRLMPRSTIAKTSPSAPRALRARMRTRTLSPWRAPPIASGGTKTSSPLVPGVRLATKPNPRGWTVRSPLPLVVARAVLASVAPARAAFGDELEARPGPGR